jgi:hypothetical protein
MGAVQINEPVSVTLRLTTETGWVLAGEQVQAVLLAPLGSTARLVPGAYGHTDEDGIVTINVTVVSGLPGEQL